MLFVTHLATLGLSCTTIKVYLSAVRNLHTAVGHHSLYYQQFTPRLQQVLKEIQKTQATFKSPRIRLPITLNILSDMHTVLQHQPTSHNNLMIWAASCLAFFGVLRSSELTVPSQDTYDPSIHLSVNDVAVDSRLSPTMIQVTIKQSKTDPFRQGVNFSWERLMLPFAQLLFFCPTCHCEATLLDLCLFLKIENI